jgi:DNA mismatch repair protein MutS
VQALVTHAAAREALRRALRGLPDLERLLGRARAGTATARQLVTLRAGLERLPAVAAAARLGGSAALAELAEALGAGSEVAAIIGAALADDPPAELADGGTARGGFDPAIDEARELAGDARSALAAGAGERERSGLGGLRVGYHRVFGYYLRCARRRRRVPADYEARQTLATVQRYRCPGWARWRRASSQPCERLEAAERDAVRRVRGQVAQAGAGVERARGALARLDVAAASPAWPRTAAGAPELAEAARW